MIERPSRLLQRYCIKQKGADVPGRWPRILILVDVEPLTIEMRLNATETIRPV